jgi:hypothetical protein
MFEALPIRVGGSAGTSLRDPRGDPPSTAHPPGIGTFAPTAPPTMRPPARLAFPSANHEQILIALLRTCEGWQWSEEGPTQAAVGGHGLRCPSCIDNSEKRCNMS